MIPEFLRPLFWDVSRQHFDPGSHPKYTIARILEHGDRQAVAWMGQAFSEEQIRQVIRTDRGLSRKSANFWALVYNIPVSEVAALRHGA